MMESNDKAKKKERKREHDRKKEEGEEGMKEKEGEETNRCLKVTRMEENQVRRGLQGR